MFARLDRGTRQHNALHLSALQRLHRGGHREIGLTRSRRTDAEGDDVVLDGVGVALLTRRRGANGLTLRSPSDLGLQHVTGTNVVAHHVNRAAHLHGVEGLATFQDQHQFVKESQHLLGFRSGDRDLVALHRNAALRVAALDGAQILVARPKETGE